jgi:hypothetical protein
MVVLDVKGVCDIEMFIGSYNFIAHCIIINNLAVELILGSDILVGHGTILDFKNNNLEIGNTSVKIVTTEDRLVSCLINKKRINLKPLTEHVEWVRLPNKINDSIL